MHSFPLIFFMFYITECKQQLFYEIIHTDMIWYKYYYNVSEVTKKINLLYTLVPHKIKIEKQNDAKKQNC